MSNIPTEFRNVTVATKANIYFGGQVVSHSVVFADGSKKTVGLIHPGKYHFGTEKAERMELVAGQCTIKVDGTANSATYGAGQSFEVASRSGFDIEVSGGICEYICSYLG